jgi:nucleotide-binding universal stress UspA family protein
MNPWMILLGLAVVALVFVLVPVGASAFAAWRRPVRLTCPRTRTEAQVRVPALAAAIASLFGRDAAVERCSLWHAVLDCREECLALPGASRRPVPAGTPPPRPGGARYTILVPLDGQPGSEGVLGAVADLARAHAATVRLVRVVAPPHALRSDDGTFVFAFSDQETARQERETRAYLSAVAERLPDVTVQSAVRFGDTITGIVDEAEAAGADLIALASHRRHPFSWLFRRSVAARVRRATRIPTLVVPYGERRAA